MSNQRKPLAEARLPAGAPFANGRSRARMDVFEAARSESYSFDPVTGAIQRTVMRSSHDQPVTTVVAKTRRSAEISDAHGWADWLYLRTRLRPDWSSGEKTIRVADLFAGCGAMSLGVAEACRALGHRFQPVGAFDISDAALSVYGANFGLSGLEPLDLGKTLARTDTESITPEEKRFRRRVGPVDFVVAGPPCQGHSNLNNLTRRTDSKNSLYFQVARFAKVFKPTWVIIENVLTVLHDKGHVVGRTTKALERLGYEVKDGVIDAWRVGVPQSRRRHFLMAVLRKGRGKATKLLPDMATLVERYDTAPRPLSWAIEDLRGTAGAEPLHVPSVASPVTQNRINFLFKRRLYDLPDSQRPECHRAKPHRYQSVYGRLRWDRLAPTMTGGFVTMGRGRFVHPSQRRTLTPREAARIQFIPDFWDFSSVDGSRSDLTELIGNAVPPKMSYIVALELLR